MLHRLHSAQLDILGITEEYLLMAVIAVVLLVLLVIFMPLIRILIYFKYIYVLNYIVTALIFLIAAGLLLPDGQPAVYRVCFIALSVYGIIHIVLLTYQTIRKNTSTY